MSKPTYLLAVDWNNDADFADTGEDVTARLRRSPALSCSRGRDQVRSLSQPSAGKLDAELDNQSKDYSPEYGASPLTGNLLPGRRVDLRATFNAVTYRLWQGVLDDLVQHPERSKKSVGIPSLGRMATLRALADAQKISTALYPNILTSTAIGYVLDAVGWPAADRVLDTGKTMLLWWWLEKADPWQALVDLWATEGPGAVLTEDGQGRIVFESRHYRLLTSRCLTPQATFRDSGAEPLYSEPFSFAAPAKDVVNICTAEIKVRSAKTLGVVWTLGSTVTLGPNEARAYLASATDPFTAAVCVVTTDYIVSAGSLSSVVLDRTSGQSCTVTLTAGASGATVTGLQIRAQTVSVDNTVQVTNSLDTSASQAKYQGRAFPLAIRPEISVNDAQDFCNAVVRAYQEPRGLVSLTLNGGHADRLTQALAREISDRVTVVNAQMGLDANDDFYLEHIRHETDGHNHVTTFGGEKVVETQQFWLLGTAGYSEVGETTTLGY